MGTWGVGLFSDDLASDVRDDFVDLIEVEGLSVADAVRKLVKEYATELADPDQSSVFWLALAATQLEYGALDQQVSEQAMRIIETGADEIRWREEPKQLAKRARVLENLRKKLESPSAARKRFKKRAVHKADFDLGDAFCFELGDGRHVVFRVLGFFEDSSGAYPWVELCDWIGVELPSSAEIESMKHKSDPDCGTQFLLVKKKESDFPRDRIRVVAKSLRNLRPSFSSFSTEKVIYWRDLEKWLTSLF